MRKRLTHVVLAVMLLMQPVVSVAAMQFLMPPLDESVALRHESAIHPGSLAPREDIKPTHPGCHELTNSGPATKSIHSSCGPDCTSCCAMAPSLVSFSIDVDVRPVHLPVAEAPVVSLKSQPPPRLYRPPRLA